jgi:hypothetical protein
MCFASVQNCETYPPARGKKPNKFKKQNCLCMLIDMKQQKFDMLHLSLRRKYSRKSIHVDRIIKRILQIFIKPLHSQYDFKNEIPRKDVQCSLVISPAFVPAYFGVITRVALWV